MSSQTLLITGVSGHVGYRVLVEALSRGYHVRAVIRKAEQEKQIRNTEPAKPFEENLEFAIVEDLLKDDTFDGLLDEIDAVVHVASPLPLATDDYKRDIIDPAVQATIGIMRSAAKVPSVKRVVITSSMATLLPMEYVLSDDTEKVFTANDTYPPPDPKGPFIAPIEAYAVAKSHALAASEQFIKNERPGFDLISVLPSTVIGKNELNTSKEQLEASTNGFVIGPLIGRTPETPALGASVHLHDVARVHIDALNPSIPGNRRLLCSSGGTEGTRYDDAKEIVHRHYNIPLRLLNPVVFSVTFVKVFSRYTAVVMETVQQLDSNAPEAVPLLKSLPPLLGLANYGPIVRLSTNRVGFTDGRAWKDVYGHKTASQRKVENVKDPQTYGPESNGRYTLLSTFNDVDHGQLRKLFTHGFSERALKSQEHLIRANVDKLIRNIDQSLASNPKAPLDFVRLFNCVTFDTTGELAFGETLGLLDGNDKMYRWVDSLTESTILSPYLQILSGFPLALKVVYAFLPKQIRLSFEETGRYASDLVDKRLEKGLVTDTADFWTLILKANQENIIDVEDMKANANLFMAAGTETTATMLSGFMFNILSNPDKLEKVVKEVRESFTSIEELTSSNIQKLKYLAACCDESMRLYPSTPIGPPRIVLGNGGEICGQFVPQGTRVSVSTFAAFRSPDNFSNPEAFVPERWIPTDPLYERYANDNRDVFQPFSFGPRNCIGRSLALYVIRLVAARLLWSYDFEMCDESAKSWMDQKMYWALWYKPPLWLKATQARQGL
ncbi:Cytochrome P450 [Stemphylium lycopersici]|nr:Cytochrome P450 [Stemphylium lycopersici]